MPTIVNKTIGNGTRDYTSITAWESAAPANLVTADQVWIGTCYNDHPFDVAHGENATITFYRAAGSTDANHYRKLTVANGHRHLGVKTAGAYVDGVKFRIARQTTPTTNAGESYFYLEWLRFTNSGSNSTGDTYIIDAIGDGINARYLTFNKLLLHNWACDGDGNSFFGIRLSGNGGCRILDCVMTDLYKDNTEADDGDNAGIYIGSSVAANLIANCTITNLTCRANFMFSSGAFGVYDSKTKVVNCIGLGRQYTYDHSSIPNVEADILTGNKLEADCYKYDFIQYGNTDGSDGYSCEQLGGYYKTYFLPQRWLNKSIVGQWIKVRTSTTGQYSVALLDYPNDTSIYYSNDYGQTWSAAFGPYTVNFTDLAISGDGTHITAVGSRIGASYSIIVSSDSGSTWSTHEVSQDYDCFGMSRNGLLQIASSSLTYLAYSTDGGTTWSSASSWTWDGIPGVLQRIRAISLSANGLYALITVGGDSGGRPWVGTWDGSKYVFISKTITSSGDTIPISDFQGTAMSDSGQYMAACCTTNEGYHNHHGGRLYKSSNYGATWIECITDYWNLNQTPISSSTNTTPIRIETAYTLPWTRVGTTVTITKTNHGLGNPDGERVKILSSSDLSTIPLGLYPITYLTPNTFSITANNTGAASGTVILEHENETTYKMSDGYRVRISGHKINNNANGTYYVKSIDDTHFDLYHNQALTIPVTGNGIGGYTGVAQAYENQFRTIAMSADGSTISVGSGLIARHYGNGWGKFITRGDLFKSFDYGNTWTSDKDFMPKMDWQCITLSGNGKYGYAAIYNDYLKVRNNNIIQSTAQDTFQNPGGGPDTGNGFYGYAFHAKGLGFYGKHNDNFIYQALPGETGTITFNTVYVMDLIAGYKYINANLIGPLVELNTLGVPYYADGYSPTSALSTPTRTLSGSFSYNRNANTFTWLGGSTVGDFNSDFGNDFNSTMNLTNFIEMVNGRIQFKTSCITTDWSVLPAVPDGYGTGIFVPDGYGYGLIASSVVGPRVMCVGAVQNNGFDFEITGRTLIGVQDLRLQNGSASVGTGTILTEPELTTDITGMTRSAPWNMGAYSEAPAASTTTSTTTTTSTSTSTSSTSTSTSTTSTSTTSTSTSSTSTSTTSTSTSTTSTSTTSTSTSTTVDSRVDLQDVELEMFPTHSGLCDLWVGFDPGYLMKSWKILYAEKPYLDYVVGADFNTDPAAFTLYKSAILTRGPIENRVLIKGISAGKQYKVQVLAYSTSSQNKINKYLVSREVYAPKVTTYLDFIGTVVPQDLNSGKGEVVLTWDNVDTTRDDNGYDVEYVLGGSGQINATRLPSGTKTLTISNLESKKYQFKLKRYDIDSNAVEFTSNEVLVPNRTAPTAPLFNSSMITWIDQGPNSGSNQVIQVQINIPIDVTYIQVIAVSGVGTKSSEKISTNGYYINAGVMDNQTVSYKLRSIDTNGNYADSGVVGLVIDSRTSLTPPVII